MATYRYKRNANYRNYRNSYEKYNKSNFQKDQEKSYSNKNSQKDQEKTELKRENASRVLIYEYNPDTKSINYIAAAPLFKYGNNYIGEIGLCITGEASEEKPAIIAYYGYISCKKTNNGEIEAYIFNNLVTTRLNPSKMAAGYYESPPLVLSTAAVKLPIWSDRLIKIPLMKFVLE